MRGRSWLIALFMGMVSVIATAQLSFGAGFALYEGSARGNALGGGLVGRADDPSALFYNPAGITQLDGIQAQAGATFIMPGTTVVTHGELVPPSTATKSTDTEDNVWIPPSGYLTYQFSDRVWFGLGTFSRFGLGTEFPEDWPGRFNNYKAIIETFSINPNIAFKVTDQFSAAVGLEVMYFDLKWDRKNYVTGLGEVDASLKGDSFGYGFNLALHYEPCQYAALGASYRSQVKQHLEGDAQFSSSVLGNPDVDGSVVLPDEVFLGVAVYPTPRLSFELGAIWTRWSTFNELGVNFDPPILGVIRNITVPKEWNDVWRYNFSVEYKLLDWLDLRAGYTFDESPIPTDHADYLVPANDRHMFSFGPGFRWNKWTLDLSYTYLLIKDRDDVPARPSEGILPSDFEDGNAHLIGISVGYKF
jgi:long-chain fatty acid transport protein